MVHILQRNSETLYFRLVPRTCLLSSYVLFPRNMPPPSWRHFLETLHSHLSHEHVNTVRARNILQQYGFPSPSQLTVTTISGLHKKRSFHLAHYTCIVRGDGHHDLRTSQKAGFPPCTLYLHRGSWRSLRSPDFTKGGVSILHTVPVPWEVTVTTISGLHKRRSFHLVHCTCIVRADGHHDLRTSQKAEFPPCTLYLYRERWRSPRSPDFTKGEVSTLHTIPASWEVTVTTTSGLHKRQSFHLAHSTRIVRADGHHDLRTSQRAEFPPCTPYLYRERWRSPQSPDFTKGEVSTLHTIPVPWEVTVTTISGLHKRRGFHLVHCTRTVRADGHHDLPTSQRRPFHLAHYTCRSYAILPCLLHRRVS